MKKYLMSGIAAIAIAAAFTSCSKSTDLYEEGRKERDQQEQEAKSTVETFKEAFVNTFGTPDPTHDWGFGTPASSRAATRAFTPTHLSSTSSWDGWVSAPAADDYKSTPSDAESMGDYYKHTGEASAYNYAITTSDAEDYTLNPYVGKANIFVSGKHNITFNEPGGGSDNVVFYIQSGADVHFVNNYAYNATTTHGMYVAEGAKVTFDKNLSANVTIYNKGEIVVEDICGPYANGAIYNDGGTITCKNGLSVFNNNSQVINNGTINVTGKVTVEGSGHFRNAEDGVITVSGETLVNSNGCSWINDGEYTTGTFTYQAGSTDVINNCMLTVNGKFLINLGDTDKNCFLMNGGAGVLAQSMEMAGPSFIYMGSGSVFKVTGDALLNCTKANYGFYGPASGSEAVFHVVGDIKTSNEAQGYDITYGNKIAVVANSHFDSATGYTSTSGSYPIVDFSNCTKDVIYTAGSKPAINIPAGKCNPGFEGEEEKYDGRVMAEDLNATEASDFDYNDVVFDYKIDAANNKATIKLRAAGGIYPLTVGGVEVHAKFGFPDSYPMINTGAGTTATAEPYDYYFPSGVAATAANIPVVVTKNGIPYTLDAPTGDAAAKFCVVTTCKWLKERKFIGDAYSLFDDWVKDKNVKWTTTIKDASLLYNE